MYEDIIILAIIVIVVTIIVYLIIRSSNVSNNDSFLAMPADGKFSFPIYIINLERKPERYQYVKQQLDNMGLTNYQRWLGVDGFKTDKEDILKVGISEDLYNKGKGLAGCAASHAQVWKHLVDTKADWTLILEDDANFHPHFLQLFTKYWQQVPTRAKIVYVGHCCGEEEEKKSKTSIIETGVMCNHGYMLSWVGAKYLLDNLTPLKDPVDIDIVEHFRHRPGSFIFNGNNMVEGIRPNDYKESNGRKCMFNGIIYQNQEEQGSTIHGVNTVF